MRHAGPAPEDHITILLHPWASKYLLSYSLNLVKDFEVSSFLPCLFYSHAKCGVLSFLLYSSFLEGTRSLTLHRVFLCRLPQAAALLFPEATTLLWFLHVVAVDAVLHTKRLKGTWGLCFLAPFVVCRPLLFPAKTRRSSYPSSFPVPYLLYIILMLTEDLAPGLSSALSHSAIQVTFPFCECGDLGLSIPPSLEQWLAHRKCLILIE